MFLPNAFLISSSVQLNGGPVIHKHRYNERYYRRKSLRMILNPPQPTSKHCVVDQKAVQKVDSVFMHCGGDDITIPKRLNYHTCSYYQLNKNNNITFNY